MPWFGVACVQECMVDAADHDHLYEESIFLVSADDEADARERGAAAARRAETSYENVYGETVRWRFVKVSGVFELFDGVPGDGTEVFSRFIDRPVSKDEREPNLDSEP